MAKKTKDSNLSLEERLEQALIPNWDEPYKLPPNWCWVKLSSVSIFERGITFPASAKESLRMTTNIPCLRTANVQESLKLDDLLYVDRSYVKDNSNKLVREKDIIMSTANSRELVGKTSFVHSLTEEMTFGGFIMAIRSKIDPKYLFYFLRLQFLNGKFMGNSTQTTNIANINSATLGETETPIPPLEEQKRIVVRIDSLFAKLDEAKEKVQEVVDGFETRKAAILHQAFSGKLTEKWRAKHGVAANSWTAKKFSEVLDVRDGTHDSPSYYDSGFPLVTSKNLKDGQITDKDIKYISKEDYDKINERSKVDIGDVLFAMIGTIGNPVVVQNEPMFAIKNMALFKNIGKINPYFVKYYLESKTVIDKMWKEAKGSTQKFVPLGYLRTFSIDVPTESEQTELIRILDDLFAKECRVKEAAEAAIDQIDTMKKAILARAFRGELGTNDPSEESAVELLKRL